MEPEVRRVADSVLAESDALKKAIQAVRNAEAAISDLSKRELSHEAAWLVSVSVSKQVWLGITYDTYIL